MKEKGEKNGGLEIREKKKMQRCGDEGEKEKKMRKEERCRRRGD